MRATLANVPSSWCSIIKPLSKPVALLFAPTPNILSSIVTEVDEIIVVLPPSVMLPKNSASLADITYLPSFVTYTGDFTKYPFVSTIGRYLLLGSTRPVTEILLVTFKFPVVVRPVTLIVFDTVFPVFTTCARV